jgi:hypothetical protein
MDTLLFYTLLFIILSPGLLLTVPPIGRGMFRSGKTSMMAIIVHAVVFYIVARLLRSYSIVKLDGFAGNDDCIDIANKRFIRSVREAYENNEYDIEQCRSTMPSPSITKENTLKVNNTMSSPSFTKERPPKFNNIMPPPSFTKKQIAPENM